MDVNQRIDALVKLGNAIRDGGDWLDIAMLKAYQENAWFTPDSIRVSLNHIASHYLSRDALTSWAGHYDTGSVLPKTVGLVLAGNIPLVGFHDMVAVFVSGHRAMIKLSSKDKVLPMMLINLMLEICPDVKENWMVVERLKGYDAVIATGSNNSARYFKEYFGSVPHIIRQNKNAVGLLTGEEDRKDLIGLGHDVMTYFGLGCRNVSKLYLPQGYNLHNLLDVFHEEFKDIIHHHKYKNNFDYNHSLFLLNKENFLMTGSLLLKEDSAIPSRISCLHYSYYSDKDEMIRELGGLSHQIQCVVADPKNWSFDMLPIVDFGKAQWPDIDDYADGEDTLKFLTSL